MPWAFFVGLFANKLGETTLDPWYYKKKGFLPMIVHIIVWVGFSSEQVWVDGV